MRELYYGDNLEILRNHFLQPEAVDLVYLDPPFNSKRAYNLLFHGPTGDASPSQSSAFEDMWEWGEQAEREFGEIAHGPRDDVAQLLVSLKSAFGQSTMMAYLVMMASRLIEIHRILKSSGSLYLHCDVNASHYLKILLDVIFGAENFRNEIVWYYYNKYSAGKKSFARNFDQILFYSKSQSHVFHPQREQRDQPMRQLLRQNVNGVLKNRKDAHGHVMYREVTDKKVDAVWRIPCLQPASREMLGYPTQKPLALLERIIKASSNEGDVVLDPFCGCGTAVHAAEKLNRQWIGIDITHLAIGVIEKRLRAAFPTMNLNIHGVPRDLEGACDLADRDKFEFQRWASWLVGARPQGVRRGPDGGIDGIIWFQDDHSDPKKAVVSVKGGQKVSPIMVRELKSVMQSEQAELGLFVTLAGPTSHMRKEALTAGLYKSPGHQHAVPRVQILTIEGLLSGVERPEFINLDPSLTFRQPPRERYARVQEELHFLHEEEPTPAPKRRKAKVVKLKPARAGRNKKARAG